MKQKRIDRERKLDRIIGPPWHKRVDNFILKCSKSIADGMDNFGDKVFEFIGKFPAITIVSYLIICVTLIKKLTILVTGIKEPDILMMIILSVLSGVLFLIGIIFVWFLIWLFFKHFIPELVKLKQHIFGEKE